MHLQAHCVLLLTHNTWGPHQQAYLEPVLQALCPFPLQLVTLLNCQCGVPVTETTDDHTKSLNCGRVLQIFLLPLSYLGSVTEYGHQQS